MTGNGVEFSISVMCKDLDKDLNEKKEKAVETCGTRVFKEKWQSTNSLRLVCALDSLEE